MRINISVSKLIHVLDAISLGWPRNHTELCVGWVGRRSSKLSS